MYFSFRNIFLYIFLELIFEDIELQGGEKKKKNKLNKKSELGNRDDLFMKMRQVYDF